MAESILTTHGEQIITNAIASGNSIRIPTFIVSSSIVTLNQAMTTLPDIVMTSSDTSKYSIVKVADNTVEFRIYLNTQDGDFNIGTLGVCDENGQLVAAGNLDELIVKKRTTNDQQGNTLQFKIPINIEDVSQVINSVNQQFLVDNTTILIDSDGMISCGIVPHHVFDIFQNASMSSPPGAYPMWTGEVVYCNGAHEEFFSKAQELGSENKIRVITQSVYNSEVSSKGWTNGFVIDTTNKTIRLPTFKGILYMSNPSVQETNKVSGSSSGTYGFIALPTYIQVDTAAVPATVAQCNAFIDSIRAMDESVVHKAGTETITGNKTFSGNVKLTRSTGSPQSGLFISNNNTNYAISVQNTEVTKGTAPSEGVILGVDFYGTKADNDKDRFGAIECIYDTNKSTSLAMVVYDATSAENTSNAKVQLFHSGTTGATYAIAPASDVKGSIVTTVSKSKSLNGYFQLGNGMIVQWGHFNKQSGTVSFPKAFTSTNYALAQVQTESGSVHPNVAFNTKTTTGFNILNAGGVNNHDWIAIGY